MASGRRELLGVRERRKVSEDTRCGCDNADKSIGRSAGVRMNDDRRGYEERRKRNDRCM